jgi:hypothetical protein
MPESARAIQSSDARTESGSRSVEHDVHHKALEMDSQYLQRQRFQLQKRFRRMNSCSHMVFHSAMVQLWNYLHAQPLLLGILTRFRAETPAYTNEITALKAQRSMEQFSTEAEMEGFVFRVIEHCCNQPLGDLGPEVHIAHTLSSQSNHDQALDRFREIFLEPFCEHLDDALDQQAAVLSLLVKYKRKVEWFEREELARIAEAGERALARHLYAYLFDQGLDFHIEPQSASGEADLVSPDLILDAKVFDRVSRNVAYVTHGVNQLHTYTRDFNQTAGYLVIYRTCPEDLHFSVAAANDVVPHINVGGKTLYFLVIDICQYDAGASKRGSLKAYSVDEATLVQAAAQATAVGGDTAAPN